MACSNNFVVNNKYINENVKVACRWCMACRVDRVQELSDRFNFERLTAAHQGFSSSYLTFTFDDEHYPRNGSLDPDFSRKFIFRLRDSLKYHEFPLPSFNGRKSFKYILVGEYGGKYGRVHYHCLFAGLDSRSALPFFKKCWSDTITHRQIGIIDSLPLLPGAVRYVLKYVEKQEHGEQLDKIYYDNGLIPPFMQKSSSLGKEFYSQNIDYILEHGGTFHNGKIRPLPAYYKNLAGIELSKDNYHTRMCQIADKFRYAASMGVTPDFLNEVQAYNYEKMLINRARDNGRSVDSNYLDSLSPKPLNFRSVLSSLESFKKFSLLNE